MGSATHSRFLPFRDVVEVLLRNDALTNVADSKGCYPLHLAAWKGDAQIVRLLIHQGPSHTKVNEQVGRKGRFLHTAPPRPWQPPQAHSSDLREPALPWPKSNSPLPNATLFSESERPCTMKGVFRMQIWNSTVTAQGWK